jgi:hypothetical protein
VTTSAASGRWSFDVGPCTNNYLIAQRFLDSAELDEQLDYAFTYLAVRSR